MCFKKKPFCVIMIDWMIDYVPGFQAEAIFIRSHLEEEK